jgi:serine kinase of HPr protein (carbohydrate metabolism regulator)
MDVLGLGVLITGESGVGKSELGLELISRGHGLVADDVVEISRIAANTLEGRCPPMLKDFLEVRGLGLLNIRTIFGETAVRPKMKLKLVTHLEGPHADGRNPAERLPLADMSEDVLGVTIRRVVIPVAAGRGAHRGRGAQPHPPAARRELDGRVHGAPEPRAPRRQVRRRPDPRRARQRRLIEADAVLSFCS